ncbi:Protein spaetzle-like protein [Leptotrombidium deliense]|uniref:Protein spaetzle-like protein n=1 Tax=Leptotrombidium deliense TaxID=299467 RepID=A0A443SKH8_9ACAR|nr:Protein spaetzle-like protein [Leptotrombidium deliense]
MVTTHISRISYYYYPAIYRYNSDGTLTRTQVSSRYYYPPQVHYTVKSSRYFNVTKQLKQQQRGSRLIGSASRNVNQTVTKKVNRIHFPTERPVRKKQRLLLPEFDRFGNPSCLKSAIDTFCENVTEYPKVDLRNEIGFNPNQFKTIFADTESVDEDALLSRTINDFTEESVCQRKQRLIFPKMAKNSDNKWVYIVNDETYVQAVVAEICESPGKACAYLEDSLPPGLNSRCVQKYSTKRLLALSSSEKTYVDKFKFPSCCACYVKSPTARTIGQLFDAPMSRALRKSTTNRNAETRNSRDRSRKGTVKPSGIILFPSDEPEMSTSHSPRKARMNNHKKQNIRNKSDLDEKGKPLCLSSPNDTFCENVQNYPIIDFRNEIGMSIDEFKNIFGDKEDEEIVSRKSYIDDDLGEERVCKRRQRLVYPKMARNTDSKWVYIVNDESYTQAIVSEICEDEGKPCSYFENNLPAGISSRCVQKYSSKRLLALNADKKTYVDKFEFPSCCACYVKTSFGRNKT